MPGKVLIVDELATNRIILKVKLSAAYYDVMQATSLEDARSRLSELSPDLILLGLRSEQNGDLAEIIRSLQPDQAGRQPTPVILLQDRPSNFDRVQALRTGAEDVLCRPLEEQMLLARLRSVMRQRLSDQDLRHHSLTAHAMGFADPQNRFELPGQIGLVAQDKHATRKLQTRLLAHARHNLRMMSAEEIMSARPKTVDAARPLPAQVPDVFVMEMDSRDYEGGLRLLSELRADPGTRSSPVLAILPPGEGAMAAQLLDLGAGDVTFTDADPQEIALRLNTQLDRKRQRDDLRDRLQDGLKAAVIDPLTGLYNRRYALSYLNTLIEARGTATQDAFAVMIADLDHFKQINDTYGHSAGDAVLAHVGKLLNGHLRKDDLVARIGGEEFLIIVPGISQDQARQIATELCTRVRSTPIPLPGQTNPAQVTISIGLTLANAKTATAQEIIDQADRALYRSKSEGRNTVRFNRLNAA